MVSRPAAKLVGLSLPGGWTVVERLERLPVQTGSCFSEGYGIVREDGTKAFLKALDFAAALKADDPARALQAMTEAYNFERDLLQRCQRMDRVVRGLEDGKVRWTATRSSST